MLYTMSVLTFQMGNITLENALSYVTEKRKKNGVCEQTDTVTKQFKSLFILILRNVNLGQTCFCAFNITRKRKYIFYTFIVMGFNF